MDDKALLKLLEAGVETDAAAQHLGIPVKHVTNRIREYVAGGVLRCNGEKEAVNWKAYGKWAQQKQPSGDTRGSGRKKS